MTSRAAGVCLIFALLATVLFAAQADAHKLKVFATAEGTTVAGYAYFSGGSRAVGLPVTAMAAGAVVFTGVTEPGGTFHFTAKLRADHRITATSVDGHAATFTVRADELPESLPAGPSAVVDEPVSTAAAPPPPAADLHAIVDAAVARQVRPLREQLDAYQDEIRWRDVLGGIGYIIGLAGLAYGLTARRRRGPPS